MQVTLWHQGLWKRKASPCMHRLCDWHSTARPCASPQAASGRMVIVGGQVLKLFVGAETWKYYPSTRNFDPLPACARGFSTSAGPRHPIERRSNLSGNFSTSNVSVVPSASTDSVSFSPFRNRANPLTLVWHQYKGVPSTSSVLRTKTEIFRSARLLHTRNALIESIGHQATACSLDLSPHVQWWNRSWTWDRSGIPRNNFIVERFGLNTFTVRFFGHQTTKLNEPEF